MNCKLFVSMLFGIVFILIVMVYRGSKQNEVLEQKVVDLNEYTQRLEQEIVFIKEMVVGQGAEKQAALNGRSEASVDKLVNDAGEVLKNSLGSVMSNLESEFDRVKDQLYEEFEKLKDESDAHLTEPDGSSGFDKDSIDKNSVSSKKHET